MHFLRGLVGLIIVLLAAFVPPYLVLSFIAWAWDLALWSPWLRAALAFWSIVVALIILLAVADS